MEITLYTFYSGSQLIRVFRDSDTLSIIDFDATPDSHAPTPQPPFSSSISYACQAGTTDRYTYYAQAAAPYARYTIEHNSTFCGYTPPSCDIYIKSFTTTPETSSSNNDATVNMFCVSSFGGITYYCRGSSGFQTNTTGYFTGLIPDGYVIEAIDSNGCGVSKNFIIAPFDSSLTHFKYRLAFSDINNVNQWELRFYDMRNFYDPLLYPKDVIGATGKPVVKTTAAQSEDKTETIYPTVLDISLMYTGLDFTPSEFTSVPEQSWYVQLYRNGNLDFQGYILPDQTQDYYEDAPYAIQLQATDGLPSLKGNIWGNGSGGQGYSTFQIQQYGLYRWIDLVAQCLNQLGYNYGNTVLISSLQFNGAYNAGLWLQVSTFSDILYDSSGVAKDTYTALSLLLAAMKLCIFQSGGRFFLVNYNDLSYINSPLKAGPFEQAFYQFNSNFTSIGVFGNSVEQPMIQPIGHNYANQPINPPQALNFDKPYNIEVDITFDRFALLFNNPSFEIGAVDGQLPLNFTSNGTTNIVEHYDPVTDALGSGAYDGNFDLKCGTTETVSPYITPANSYILSGLPIMYVAQPNKLLNISFKWKVPQCSYTVPGISDTVGYIFAFTIMYTDSFSGNTYFLQVTPSKTVSYQDYLANTAHVPYATQLVGNRWRILGGAGDYYTEGDACSVKGSPTTDFVSWHDFSLVCPVFPDSQQGTIAIRFYGVKGQLSNTDNYILIGGTATYKQGFYIDVPKTDTAYCLIDDFELTLTDASPVAVAQTGENHYETAVTGIPTAQSKNVQLELFTYGNNKYVAGNVFNINDIVNGQVASLWNFATATGDKKDRLAATVSKAIARNYSRPMYIFEGDIESSIIQFYSMFVLKYFESKVFQPFSVAIDCRNSTAHIVIIEVDDSPEQFIYDYKALYANNSTQVTGS